MLGFRPLGTAPLGSHGATSAAGGTADHLTVTTQPSTPTASGVAHTTQPVVEIRDSGNALVSGDTSTVTALLVVVTGSATSIGTLTKAAVAGVANFSANGLGATSAAGATVKWRFTDGALTLAETNTITIEGTADHLTVTGQPSTTTASGAAHATQPIVEIRDSSNALVTTNTSTVTALLVVVTGSATSFGTLTKAAVAGIANFSGNGLGATSAAGATVKWRFTDGALTLAETNVITISAAPDHLTVTGQPSSPTASGAAHATQPIVEVRDSSNILVSTDTSTVTALLVVVTGSATSFGTLTKAAVAGVANFSANGLGASSTAGATVKWRFTDGALTLAETNVITITGSALPADHLTVTGQPSSPTASGAAHATQPIVEIRDSTNAVVTTDTSTVTAQLIVVTGAATPVGSLTKVAVAGVANFSGNGLGATSAGGATVKWRFTDGTLTLAETSVVTITGSAASVFVTKTHPSAFGAKYLEFSGTCNVVKTLQGARLDVVLPLGPGLASWTYTVQSGSGAGPVVASGSLSVTAAVDVFFYDGALAADASNPTVATLYSGDFGTYVVTLTGTGAGTRRLDCILAYHTDPMLPRLPQKLSTAQNALRVQPSSAMDDMRNSVIVVGRRKATVTDSAKLTANPNNPDGEFVVERIVDKASISDPTATNYIGAVKESIIFDSTITDNAYARYLARVFIYRYRNPRPPVAIEHTLLPVLQLYDPVYAEEARHQSVGVNATDPRKSVLWVTGYKHRIEGKRAMTSVSTQAFPDFPAFEPREDIDLAAFGGKPVVNMAIQYTSLAGDLKTNPVPGLPVLCKEVATSGLNPGVGEIVTVSAVTPTTSVSGQAQLVLPATAPWPPVRGTVFIRPNFGVSGLVAVSTPTLQSDFMPIRRGQVLPPVKIPYQRGITSVTIDYKFEPDKVARPTRQSEWYYEVSDEDVVSVGGGDLHNDIVDEVKATVNWLQGAKDTKLGWVTNNPYHHFFNVDYRTSSFRDNLVATSNNFTGFVASGSINGTTTGPDGVSTSGSKICEDLTNNLHGLTYAPTLVSGAQYTVSIHCKAAELLWMRIKTTDKANSSTSTWFNISTGVIGTSAGGGHSNVRISPVINATGWYRVQVTFNAATGATAPQVTFLLGLIDGGGAYTGTSTSNGMYFFGAQFNTGVSAGLYTPTTGTPNTSGPGLISLVWNQGDNAHASFQRAAATSYDVKYRRFGPTNGVNVFADPYAGTSPFYDPYSSELGHQVQISADFLVSGLYRVSVRNADDGTIVAWLTEPGADATKPESHFQYFSAGASRQFSWDGVDQIGDWNTRQSTEYAALANGAFEEKQRAIGAGFYVWNREFADRQPGQLAIISGALDTNTGEPVFGHGTYAQWYVVIETRADNLNTSVRSDNLDAANNNGVAAALVYTHLPEPTKTEIAVADWISSTDFSATDSSTSSAASAQNPSNWGAPNSEATVNNQKPVRMRFKVAQRPGPLWVGQQGNTTVKLNRLVHLRATIMDQFVTFAGTNWPNTPYEDRAIVSRRLVNDEHTNKYEDDNYRRASSLKWLDADPGTEWVFVPSSFTRNFRGIPNEPISFGDYLQLEELPKWDEGQRTVVGGNRARMQLAFMNYLWYLSAVVTDRSGRSVWAINRKFNDQSKIVNNTPNEWPNLDAPYLSNVARFTTDFSGFSKTGTGASTMTAVGLDGLPNTASVVTDTDAASNTLYSQTFTSLPKDTGTHCVAVWVKKDNDVSRFVVVGGRLLGGSPNVAQSIWLNTKTGAFTSDNSTGTGTQKVFDDGEWWRVELAMTNNALNTQMSVTLFPAAGTTMGAFTTTTTGSVTIGNVNMSLYTASSPAPVYRGAITFSNLTVEQPVCTTGTGSVRWADDPLNQHRRSIITRQWTDEKIAGTSWRTQQATRWGFNQTTTDIGWNLLRHKWSDHDVNSTTLNGNLWTGYTGLMLDRYTEWHSTYTGTINADNPTLPNTYTGKQRQLPAAGLGTLWTWETGPTWIPCVTRDFHGYFMLPPMIDRYTVTRPTQTSTFKFLHLTLPTASTTTPGSNGFAFMQVDMRDYRNDQNQNEGNDPAAGETWSSPVWDATQANDTSASSVVRFWPGHRVSTQEEPTKSKGVQSNTVDYVRQDELVHWEDLRGMYSRGKRPTEQPIKVSPVQPYYTNPFRYEAIVQDSSYHNGRYPLFRGKVSNWFSMTFRSEYLWESGAFFPVGATGAEYLEGMNAPLTRFLPTTAMSKIRYDSGAYVGWKDDWDATDAATSATNYGVGKVGFRNFESFQTNGGRALTPFESSTQVVGVGPRLPQTRDMLFHLVLVTERRSAAV